jgi:hypothetical protein
MTRKKNPVDKDKVTDHPGLLPYASHIGSAIIKPLDKGKSRGLAMKAMYQQTDKHLNQIKEQVEILIRQAQEIHDRIDFSEKIYQASCSFAPVIGNTYYLYKRKDESEFLSMISPSEWGTNNSMIFICAATLLADHTWEILESKNDQQHR